MCLCACVWVCVCVCVCACVRVCTFGRQADPVQVAGEFLGHVGLSSGGQAHHDDDRGGVGQVRPRP